MKFTCGETSLDADIDALIVAGWTGRDRAAINHHIEELSAIGVTPPSQVPLYYRVSASQLTQDSTIQVVGDGSSGEVEPLLLKIGGRTYLGLASDHTDRDLEAHSVALSKQICAKPCAAEMWAMDEIADRLDDIEMRSWLGEDGDWTLYQEGTLAAIRPLAQLAADAGLEEPGHDRGAAMLCGTLGVLSGGVRGAPAFRMELTDPILERTIRHSYRVTILPMLA